MVLPSTPLIVTRLGEAPRTAEAGETGRSLARTFELPDLRLRLVEYEAGYLADLGATVGMSSTSWRVN